MTALNLTIPTPIMHVLSFSGKIALLSFAYLLSGQLAMLLAVPPGFISAIFPPVGIALAAVLIWGYPMLIGVFLGSTLLNLSIAANSFEQLSWQHLPVACGIALGTTVQCLCASWLIRQRLSFPNPFTEDRSIMLLLLIGGPLTCLISASIGTWVLYFHQIITPAQTIFSWWSWWIGDSIGVMIATPLVFILFAKPRELWRSRAATVGLPLVLSCALMMLLFFRTSEGEQNRLQQRFHEQSKLMAQSVKSRIALYGSSVAPIERFFAASDEVSQQEFAIFVDAMAENHPGIRALSWNARVTSEQRQSFEAGIQASNPLGVVISELNDNDQLVPAANRTDYFPITFIEPLEKNLNASGYDVGSDPLRRSAMHLAADSATAQLTAPLELVQDQMRKTGMLLFYPVYTKAQPPTSVRERRSSLRGYVVAVLHIADVIESSLSDYPADSFQLKVDDITDGHAQAVFSKLTTALPAYAAPLVWQQDFDIAGRRFSMEVLPSEQFLSTQSSLQPWAILAGGLLLCSLLGGFLLSVTGRAEQVRRLVRQRTLELSGILDNAAEAILIFDSSGTIERANAAAQELFGYTQFQRLHIGTLLPEFHQASPLFLQNRQGRSIEAAGVTAEKKLLELEISLSSYALPGHIWFICLLHDISERKKVERLKSEFVATVSHELRTPLTSIKGSLELVNAGVLGSIPETAGTMLRLAQKNTERLVLLVNDILDIEKLELGEASLPLSLTDLRELLQQALAQNQGYADNFAVGLSLDLHELPATVLVSVNHQRLQQVLSNLISNAVKFSAPGSVVQLSACLRDHEVLIKVCDQGPGISQEFRSRIFQKFAQADGSDSRQRGGTGLGLSICKELMERMNGTIGFDSVEGQGSTFYIRLPLQTPIAD
jgi:PAS domain S-box-containing protein